MMDHFTKFFVLFAIAEIGAFKPCDEECQKRIKEIREQYNKLQSSNYTVDQPINIFFGEKGLKHIESKIDKLIQQQVQTLKSDSQHEVHYVHVNKISLTTWKGALHLGFSFDLFVEEKKYASWWPNIKAWGRSVLIVKIVPGNNGVNTVELDYRNDKIDIDVASTVSTFYGDAQVKSDVNSYIKDFATRQEIKKHFEKLANFWPKDISLETESGKYTLQSQFVESVPISGFSKSYFPVHFAYKAKAVDPDHREYKPYDKPPGFPAAVSARMRDSAMLAVCIHSSLLTTVLNALVVKKTISFNIPSFNAVGTVTFKEKSQVFEWSSGHGVLQLQIFLNMSSPLPISLPLGLRVKLEPLLLNDYISFKVIGDLEFIGGELPVPGIKDHIMKELDKAIGNLFKFPIPKLNAVRLYNQEVEDRGVGNLCLDFDFELTL